MSHGRATFLALLLLAGLGWFPSPAGAADGVAILKERTASVVTVRSFFVQETVIPMFSGPVRSTGRFVYKRPDSLRWEYLEPMREGFAITGKAGVRWSDDGDGERRTRFSVGSDPVAEVVARQLMAWITFDVAGIRREYGIETLALDPLILRMTPLRDDVKSVIASITITFSAEGPASVVAIEESAGGKTTISFTGTVVNAPVADGDFD